MIVDDHLNIGTRFGYTLFCTAFTGPSFAFVSQGKAVTKPQVLLGSHNTPANAARNIIKTAMAASTPSVDLLVVIVYPL